MKKIAFILSVVSLTFVSCNRVEPQPERSMVEKEFTVVSEETKTDLGNNGISILWSANDKITVIAATTGNEYDFDITDGVGNTTAKFSGQLDAADATETTFYAVYPNIKESTVSGDIVKVGKTALGHTALAIKDGIDPAFTVMAAKSVDGSAFSFKHGMAYCKVEIDQDGINKVRISAAGSGRLWGRPNIDVTSSANATQDKGKSDDNYMEIEPASGTLAQGIYYIPVTVKSSNLGNVTIEYTMGSKTSSVTTTKLSSKKMSAGNIYDMGCPPVSFTPKFVSAPDVTIEASDESGVVNFTVANLETGGYVVADVTNDELSNSSWAAVTFDDATGVGSVSFTCDANTSTTSLKTATVHLFYTTDGSTELAYADVTVTQKKAVASGSNIYYYYYTTSLTNTDSKFTPSSSNPNITFDGTTNNCGVTSFTIEGNVCTKGLKLDSGGYLDFTTSANVTASVTFYYVCRKEASNSSAKIQIAPTDPAGTATVFDNFNAFGTINSQTVALSPATKYRISRNANELVLVYVALTETPE